MTLILLFVCTLSANAQFTDSGLNYQGVLYNADSTAYLANTDLSIRFTFYRTANPGEVYYSEEHTLTTGSHAVFNVLIGQGTASGSGIVTAFQNIEWRDPMSLIVELNIDGAGYVEYENGPLWAVPYAYHALQTQPPTVAELTDVDQSTLQDYMALEWDGTQWVPVFIAQANYADTSGVAVWADTVNFAYVSQNINVDTALVSVYADSVNYASVAGYTPLVDSANFVDTASYAYDIANWRTTGNGNINVISPSFLGSTNPYPLEFRTNSSLRAEFTETGEFHIGVQDSTPDFYLNSNLPFLATSTPGTGTHFDVASATKPTIYWSGPKGGIYMGTMDDTLWNTHSTANFALVFGRNCYVDSGSHFSTAIGDGCYVSQSPSGASPFYGTRCMAVGYQSASFGQYAISVGYQSETHFNRCTALGNNAKATGGYAGVALGNNVEAFGNGSPSFVIGSNLYVYGSYSTAMGRYCRVNQVGSFGYGDMSVADTLISTGAYQFRVRSAGGVNFYSNSSLTSGVLLASGSGAWSTVSDRNKKENFLTEDQELFMQKVRNLNVYAWNYKSQPGVTHIGPTAQSMYALFGYGGSATTITTTDIDGVIMYGITLLAKDYHNLKEVHENNTNQSADAEELEYESLDARLDALEKKMESLEDSP